MCRATTLPVAQTIVINEYLEYPKIFPEENQIFSVFYVQHRHKKDATCKKNVNFLLHVLNIGATTIRAEPRINISVGSYL